MADPGRLVIVGGGVTGLAAAHEAVGYARQTGRSIAVTVVEATDRLGGVLVTQREQGFLLDGGPDSWVAAKPQATNLARALGLGASLVGTNPATRRYYVLWDDVLHPVPEGLVLGVPTRWTPLVRSRLFTWAGKIRMALEPLVPARRFEGDEDESIAAFATRRLGRQAAERLVAPLLGGISSGDASDISVRAAFPQLVAMERDHGSLVRGMRAAAQARTARAGPVAKGDASAPGAAAGSAFVSLRGGVGELVQALAERIETEGVAVRRASRVASLARARSAGARGYTLELSSGERLAADAVLLAVPAHAAARLIGPIDVELAASLGAIRFGSSATVFFGYRRADVVHPLDGVGFVVPRALGRSILAGTWVSSKWHDRAPEGHVLVRAFLGGDELLARDDAALVQVAGEELGTIMGLRAQPLFARVFRFENARPQMRVGHLATMRAVHERLARVAPDLLVAGDGYDGAGIPDCVRQGQSAARALVERTGETRAAAPSRIAM